MSTQNRSKVAEGLVLTVSNRHIESCGKPPNLHKESDNARRGNSGAGEAPATTTGFNKTGTVLVTRERGLMTVQTLNSNYYVTIPVDVNTKVFAVFSNVTLRVEAEYPVDVFVVDAAQLEPFRTGQQFNAFYSAIGVTAVTQSVLARVNPGQLAYVVIRNRGPQSTAVYYEVS